jgi:tetratricopeptide (TPR) repeat protein
MPPRLKLVSDRERGHVARWPLALGLLIAASAVLATLSGADRTRRAAPVRQIAQETLDRALERGSGDANVRRALLELRRRLGRQPLDTRTRVAYSGLLLGLSRSVADTRAAVFHAELAADLSPVTAPVVQASTLILARAGEWEDALRRVREMFLYDAGAAADLLLTLEPWLPGAAVEAGLAEAPEAWLAWVHRLRREGRADAADSWLEGVIRRWPEHPAALEQSAAKLVREQRWQELADLLPDHREIPEEPGTARIFAYRARARAWRGDLAGARGDVELALRLDGDEAGVQIVAGDAYASMGDFEQARELWHRARFTLPPSSEETRRGVLLRLARLEDRHGRPATALRLWRSLLELDPAHGEAQRRVEELTGR